MKKRKQRFTRLDCKGQTKSPNYSRYSHMRRRCYLETDPEYPRYGAKGIKVFDEWLIDFWKYHDYIMSLPNALKPDYTVDRIDSEKSYEPGNLRWATKTTQSRNCKTGKNNKSGVTGVCWHKASSKWRAYLMIDYKHIGLGLYNKLEDAIEARKNGEQKYKFNNH